MTRFQTLDELIEHLRRRQVTAVTLAGKVATHTSPGGRQITFRGRLLVFADLGGGEKGEYQEPVERVVTETGAPELPIDRKRATDLQAAQAALLRQLTAYRSRYQSVMQTAREQLARRLSQHGVRVVEGKD